MANQKEKNWLKLNLLLDKTRSLLKDVFVHTWKNKFGSEWDKSCAPIITAQVQFQNGQHVQRKAIEEADPEKWDISTLKTVLTAEHFLDLRSDQPKKIVEIWNVCNKIADLSSKIVPEKQFSDLWNELEQLTFHVGLSDSDLQKLVEECRQIDGVDKAVRLKEKGNSQFTNGDYAKAIELFTQGLELLDLPAEDRAELYSGRCEAYLAMYNANQDRCVLFKGKVDAKRVIELRPEWWRGYFCLGTVYIAMEMFEKAEQSLRTALIKDPYKQEVMDILNSLRSKQGSCDTTGLKIGDQYFSVTMLDFDEQLAEKVRLNVNSNSIAETTNGSSDTEDGLLGPMCCNGSGDNNLHTAQLKDQKSVNGKCVLESTMQIDDGVDQDFELGMKILKEAAAETNTVLDGIPKDNEAEAEFSVGMCYYKGVGTVKNGAEALHWFERASEHGCCKAITKLGMMYEGGEVDNKPDLEKAEQFYELAVKTQPGQNPSNYAMYHLSRLYLKKGDYERALEWGRRTKDCGNLDLLVDQLIIDATERIDAFMKSDIVTWELQNKINTVGMTMAEREEQYYKEHDPELAAVIANVKLLHSKMTRCSLTKNTRKPRFDPCELEECAKYSAYARSLWNAQKHFLKAVCVMLYEIKSCTNPSLDMYERFVTHFSAAIQTDSIVVEIESEWHEEAWSIVRDLLKQNTSFDEDVRICYATFQVLSSPDLALEFLCTCLQKYPKHFFFLKFHAAVCAMLRLWEEGMRDINVLVQMDSHNPEVLQILAGLVKLSVPTVQAEVAVEAYVDFIAHAPEGHRAVPESYYAIASLIYDSKLPAYNDGNKKLSEVKRYYNLGLTAEKKQLKFFLPYQSNTKALVEFYLSDGTAPSPTSQCHDSELSTKKGASDRSLRSQKLNDPNRIATIKDYRRIAGKRRQVGTQFSFSFPVQSPQIQPSPVDTSGLKEMYLRDVDSTKSSVYEGCFVIVTVIDEVCLTDSFIVLLVEDINGDVEHCGVHSWPQMEDIEYIRQVFGLGCKLKILNPYMRITTEGKAVIHVDNPSLIIILGFVHKICRYCGQPDADKLCSRCKNALYCDKTCQVLDWKTLKHKLICC